MTESKSIVTREEQIAETSFSSPASFETVKATIDLPKELSGKYILDIGGGASSATFELRKRGALAFAVDYRYEDMDVLRRSVDKYLLGDSRTHSYPYEKEYVSLR